jgi:hypothetical protein
MSVLSKHGIKCALLFEKCETPERHVDLIIDFVLVRRQRFGDRILKRNLDYSLVTDLVDDTLRQPKAQAFRLQECARREPSAMGHL